VCGGKGKEDEKAERRVQGIEEKRREKRVKRKRWRAFWA